MLIYLVQRVLLVCTPLALGVCAAEFYASTTEAGNAALFVADNDLYVARKPGTHGYTFGDARWIPVYINHAGMRDEDLPNPRDSKERWVLCIGDSFTFGGGVETHEAWPQQTQQIVGDPATSRVRVLNAGANGWDTAWQRLYLEKRGLRDVKPDIVVLGFNWNDLETAIDAPQQAIGFFIECRHVPYLRVAARSEFLRSTHLYRMLYSKLMGTETVPTDKQLGDWYEEYRQKRLVQVIQPEKQLEEVKARRRANGTLDDVFWQATDSPDWKIVRSELTRMRDLCRAANVKLLVAQMPEPSWDGPGRFPGAERLDAMLASLEVPTVDLQPAFFEFDEAQKRVVKAKGLWQRYDPVHPTPKGHHLIAEGIATKLRELGWVDNP
jgi:lysophospholipase L1-like esterase